MSSDDRLDIREISLHVHGVDAGKRLVLRPFSQVKMNGLGNSPCRMLCIRGQHLLHIVTNRGKCSLELSGAAKVM